jgi:hypothetical protein
VHPILPNPPADITFSNLKMSVPVTGLFLQEFHPPWSSLWAAVVAVEMVAATLAVAVALAAKSTLWRTSHYLQGTPSRSLLVPGAKAAFGTVRRLQTVNPVRLTRPRRSQLRLPAVEPVAQHSVALWAYSNRVSRELELVQVAFRLEQMRQVLSTRVVQRHLGADILREMPSGRTQIPSVDSLFMGPVVAVLDQMMMLLARYSTVLCPQMAMASTSLAPEQAGSQRLSVSIRLPPLLWAAAAAAVITLLEHPAETAPVTVDVIGKSERV